MLRPWNKIFMCDCEDNYYLMLCRIDVFIGGCQESKEKSHAEPVEAFILFENPVFDKLRLT
jgi:hypothetical protein